jgi:hypothetical protein
MSVRGIPPRQGIGGRAKERECQALFDSATPLRPPTQLAEGVEFPEKKREVEEF